MGRSVGRLWALAFLAFVIHSHSAVGCEAWRALAGRAVRYVLRQPTPSESGVPIEWGKDHQPGRRLEIRIPEGKTLDDVSIPSLFLAQARRYPDRVILIDEARGPMTNRDIVAGVYFLKPKIEALGPEPHIGVMLPASAGATVTTLAVQFAGKTPAMLNFTTGSRNLRASMETAGVKKILTSRKFVETLLAKSPELKEFESQFVYLEDFRTDPVTQQPQAGSKLELAAALAKSRFTRWYDLNEAKVAQTSVILFTSGSSGTPKAVPLTHQNQIANIRDILSVVPLYERDRIIGTLPPLHSFGATGNIALPLVTGAKIAYYPNPLQGKGVAEAVDKYGGTVILGTPTFLQLMARGSKDGQLKTLRIGIVGAERTTEKAAQAIADKTPKNFVLLDAYGTTEASPAVSINDPHAPVPGTVGIPLPSMEVMVAVEDASGVLKPAQPGQLGKFIIRGPNVFGGYLNYKGPSPFVHAEGKVWYDTGDLAVQDPVTKVVTLKGRANMDFEKIGGEMVSFQAIIDVLNEKYRVADANRFVIASDKRQDKPRLVLFTTQEGLTTKEVNDALVAAGLTNLYGIQRIVTVKSFPLLGSGKLDKKQLVDRAQTDE